MKPAEAGRGHARTHASPRIRPLRPDRRRAGAFLGLASAGGTWRSCLVQNAQRQWRPASNGRGGYLCARRRRLWRQRRDVRGYYGVPLRRAPSSSLHFRATGASAGGVTRRGARQVVKRLRRELNEVTRVNEQLRAECSAQSARMEVRSGVHALAASHSICPSPGPPDCGRWKRAPSRTNAKRRDWRTALWWVHCCGAAASGIRAGSHAQRHLPATSPQSLQRQLAAAQHDAVDHRKEAESRTREVQLAAEVRPGPMLLPALRCPCGTAHLVWATVRCISPRPRAAARSHPLGSAARTAVSCLAAGARVAGQAGNGAVK